MFQRNFKILFCVFLCLCSFSLLKANFLNDVTDTLKGIKYSVWGEPNDPPKTIGRRPPKKGDIRNPSLNNGNNHITMGAERTTEQEDHLGEKANDNANDEVLTELRAWARELGEDPRTIESLPPKNLLKLIKSRSHKGQSGENQDLIFKLQEIACSLGIPAQRVENLKSFHQLLSEINIKLGEKSRCRKIALTDEDQQILDACLADEPDLLEKIRKIVLKYKQVSGQQILILSPNE